MLGIIVAGFGVGLIVGLTGVGGGSLMTPLLVDVFGIPLAVAVGTDLLFAASTKAVAAGFAGKARLVDWRTVGWLLAGSLPSSILVSLWVGGLDANTASAIIRPAIGLALLMTAVTLLSHSLRSRLRPLISAPDPTPSTAALAEAQPAQATHTTRRGLILAAVGVAVGTLTALSSIGVGAIIMAVLVRMFPHEEPRRLVGTDIAHAVPVSFVAGIAHASAGHLDVSLLFMLLAGSLPGIALAALLASRISPNWLRAGLGVLLGWIGGRYVWAAFI